MCIKNARRKYLTERRAISAIHGSLMFFPDALLKPLHNHSDIVPTGHIQLQKPLLKSRAVNRIVPNITNPAGWIGSIIPVRKKYFTAKRAPIGRKASTPGGLGTNVPVPPLSQNLTN